jgi:hypothetical protein
MHSHSSARLLAALTLCGLAGFVAVPALAGHTAAKKTTVTVTDTGKSVKLSKTSFIAAGPVVVQVVNKDKVGHAFRVCSAPRVTAAAKTCVGKVTPVVSPGKSATLTVTLGKGSYEYLATAPGQPAVTGLIGVAVKAGDSGEATTTTPSAPATTTTPTTTTAPPAAGGTPGQCNIDGTIVPC